MKKRLSAIFLLFLVVLTSILIMIIPTFFTKGISRTTLHQEFELPLILNDEKEIKLVFFGYSGCSDICTPRLQSIDKFYIGLKENEKQRVGVEFLDISVPYDKTLPDRFAKFFNKNFKGIYLENNVLREYTKEFHVFFSNSLIDKSEYDHTTNLYLVKKDSNNKKEIRYIYNAYPYDFKQIKRDTEELLYE